MLLGLVAVSSMSSGSAFKGLAMVALGLKIGLVGIDINTGIVRFNLGMTELIDGVSLVAVGMGLFGASEVLNSLRNPGESRKVQNVSLRAMLQSRGDLMVFVERPISLVILLVTVGVIGWALFAGLRGRRSARETEALSPER